MTRRAWALGQARGLIQEQGPAPTTAPTTAPTAPGTAPLNGHALAQPGLLARMKNGVWLDAQTFAPLHYHVDGLLPEGFTLLAGPPKAGKSFLVAGWLLELAAAGRPVLYLCV